MCACNKGKISCDGQAHRKPVGELRVIGRKRRISRHDLGDALSDS